MQEIVALEIEETKAVVGGVKIGEPPVVGLHPEPVLTVTAEVRRRR
jgi:hypothetical protein